jgi:hypothetical protein
MMPTETRVKIKLRKAGKMRATMKWRRRRGVVRRADW